MSETPTPERVTREEAKAQPTLLDRVLERRGLDRSALEYIRAHVEFPDLILTPTNSQFKTTFLTDFMADLVPDGSIGVKGIRVSSDVHEQPFGPETREGAERRTANAVSKAESGQTGDPDLDRMLEEFRNEGKKCGYVGAIENGMVKGKTNSDGKVELDISETVYNPDDEHFDVAFTIINFPPNEPITIVSPPEEAVRFNPEDANASAAEGFNVTAGEKMRARLERQGITIDKQNWHGYVIQQEIEQAKKLRATGQPTVGLHTEEFAGFDRNEQLTGVLFDGFYALAKQREAANQEPQ